MKLRARLGSFNLSNLVTLLSCAIQITKVLGVVMVISALLPFISVAQYSATKYRAAVKAVESKWPVADDGAISVGRNVQISHTTLSKPLFETWIAADPEYRGALVACSIVGATIARRFSTSVFISQDGGKSWAKTLDTATVGYRADALDPACEFGINAMAFHSVLLPHEETPGIHLYTSLDRGQTWKTPTFLPIYDREFVAVDRTIGKYHGRVYVNGSLRKTDTHPFGAGLFYSADGGVTFRGPGLYASPNPAMELSGMSNGVVLSDGTWLSLVSGQATDGLTHNEDERPKKPNARLLALVSRDGGESIQSPSTITTEWYRPQFVLHGFNASWSVVPSLAADSSNSVFKDRLYAVWTDGRYGRFQIWLSYSADQGNTWSKPRAISDDRPLPGRDSGPDQAFAAIAVNKDGVVGVTWNDRRDSPDNLSWYVRFTASFDGGDTWEPSVRVSTAPARFGRGAPRWLSAGRAGGGVEDVQQETDILRVAVSDNNRFGYSGGDTRGMAADAAGVFHPVWVDNRTGKWEMWTTGVRVNGIAIKNGWKSFASLDDISRKVVMDLQDVTADLVHARVTVTATLRNTSKNSISGPLIARAIAVSSELGDISVIGADNGKRSAGAVWDFTKQMSNGRLLQGESTQPRQLRFKVSNMKSFYGLRVPHFNFVNLECKILGKLNRSND